MLMFWNYLIKYPCFWNSMNKIKLRVQLDINNIEFNIYFTT